MGRLMDHVAPNGTNFLAFVQESVQFLGGQTVVDYYAEPLPSPTDERLDGMVKRLMTATAVQRTSFHTAVTDTQRALFGIYGHRAATLAVRAGDSDQLLRGLVGAAIANYTIPDRRNVEVALAVYYHCARKLGLNTVDLFDAAEALAGGEIAGELARYGRRSDVTLRKFG
ncbi:MAG: hypothetical protein H6659_18850 [Ardenticatenaceae bacterium]|nr:hypothetical protein [Ardenticatenaceae bacterium]MCB8986932.1 hypothetical protein [Ardenticatenaceae bacterium]